MSKLRISDAPLLPDVNGSEKIPTGGRGDLAINMEQVKTFAQGGLPQQIEDHINDTENPHQVSKTQVGLGNVDNTSDVNKPISTATQEALDLKADKTAVHSKSVTLPTYYTKEVGVNTVIGVADGAYFNVRSEDDDTVAIEYQNVGGSAVATGKSYPSSLVVNEVKEAIIDPETGKAVSEKIFNLSGRTVQDRLDDALNLRDYYKLKVGNDWSDALIKAVLDGKNQRKGLYIPGGTYDYSKSFTIEIPVFGAGYEVTRLRKTSPATITVLKGGLNEIKVSPDAILPGDTSNGVVLDGVDRKDCFELWSERHGGHGIEYRRGNLSRFVVRGRGNNGRGVNFAADPVSGDNKACEIFIEATGNGLSGFYIEQSATVVHRSSSHYGCIRAQNNGGRNVTDDNFDVVLTGGGHELNIYAEYGIQSVWHRDGLRASRIFYSNMSHPRFRNDATGDYSNIISYVSAELGSRTTMNENFEMWTLHNQNKSISGRLSLSHVANNTFRFEATLSGAQQYLELPTNLTLRGEGDSYNFAKRYQGGGTLNFSTVAAQSAVERTITVTNIALSSLQTAALASPAGDVGAGLVWSAFVSAFDAVAKTATVTIRVANPTTVAVTSNQLAWRVQVIT